MDTVDRPVLHGVQLAAAVRSTAAAHHLPCPRHVLGYTLAFVWGLAYYGVIPGGGLADALHIAPDELRGSDPDRSLPGRPVRDVGQRRSSRGTDPGAPRRPLAS